ncbi:hypothetical protein EG856_01835 [Mycoplasmopsis phocirhinis]|uniref:Lipoprotein n=1 Tax=Mycoplasmopsis phocirhinis TaxID=142650 RepID=A0A4P6MTI2_9BACT|nr:P80 family lipoprotein [Mycoplasmopsis phocirhinis]QBF34657.1 hypothetical protein EG856_01835 [Mycoplasmopsis phocirhinis]
MKGIMKKNKLLLSGSLVALAAPISLVACNKETNFDTKRQKLKFSVTFSRDRAQWNAVDGVIKVYNQEVEKKRKALQEEINQLKSSNADKNTINQKQAELDTYMEVELIQDGSGYGSGHQNILSALKNNDTVKLPNLTVNYGATIAEIVNYGRQVDLSDQKYGDLKIERNTFEDRFTANNDKIDGAKAGGFYSVPFLKSTHAFGINGPIYKYVLKTLKDNGYTISEDLVSDFKVGGSDWNADIEVIKTVPYFGPAKSKEKIEAIFTEAKYPGKKIDKSHFEEFTKFIKFITDAIQIFESSSSTNSTVSLLGIDDPARIFGTVLYSKVNGNDEEMAIRVTTSATGAVTVGFESLSDTESVAYKNNDEIYKLITNAVKSGALRIFGGGSYSSSEQTQHKIGANFGSTAGYVHNFIKTETLRTTIKLLTTKDSKPVTISSTDFGLAKLVEDKDNNENKPALNYGSFTNKFFKSNEEVKEQYYWKSVDTASDSIYDVLNTTAASTDKDTTYIIKVKDTEKDLLAYLDRTYTGTDKLLTKLGTVDQYERSKKSGTYVLYKSNNPITTDSSTSEYQITLPTAPTTLQEEELVVKYPPRKYNENSLISTSFLQGPNLYVIDNGEKQNKATLRFLKWTFNNQAQFNFDPRRKETALSFISKTASYVIPYKGFANDTELQKSSEFKNNKYLSLSFDLFKDVNARWYEEPTSKFANQFRDSINSAYKTEAESIRESGKTPAAFDKFVAAINKTVKNFK